MTAKFYMNSMSVNYVQWLGMFYLTTLFSIIPNKDIILKPPKNIYSQHLEIGA